MKKNIISIPYMEILKKAWEISWHHKFLWWFGLLVSLGGGSSSFRMNMNAQDFPAEQQEKIVDFLTQNMNWLVPAAIVLGIIFLILIFIGIIARGALIKSTYQIINNVPADFRTGWKEGKKYFWKILGTNLLLGLFVILFLIVLIIPIVFLFISKAYVIGGILLVLAILILIPLIILTAYVSEFSQLYIVLGELSIREAIENAYTLFRKNILASIVMSLLFIPIGIMLFFSYLIALIPFLLVFGGLAAALYFTIGKIAAIIAAIIGLLGFFICIMVIAALYAVFSQTAWILFFQEIATPTEEEKVEETIHEVEEEAKALPTPEPMKPIKME